MISNEIELTYLVILVVLTMLIHLILAQTGSRRRSKKL